jgi:hypothetical protein
VALVAFYRRKSKVAQMTRAKVLLTFILVNIILKIMELDILKKCQIIKIC